MAPSVQKSRPRVSKTLSPNQPGAIKLARRHGDALVCVRYRLTADGRHRWTTIELIVERIPVVRRTARIVGVRIGFEETRLQQAVRAKGATWDRSAKLWRLDQRAAAVLGLESRIVAK
jgi:hypothetical protein